MYVFSRFARPSLRIGLLVASFFSTLTADAFDLAGGDLKVHGFVSQGLVHTTDNNFLGESDGQVSHDFREIGVNASWRLVPDIQLSAELLSHRAGGTDDGSVRLDYGLVDWTALSSEHGRAGLRLGRLKTAYGLYNKTRDVAFTRPSIILPQSIYFERTRNLTVSADGAELYAERYGETGSLTASFALGEPKTQTEAAKVALFLSSPPGELEARLAPDLQLLYEGAGNRYRLAFTALQLDLSYRPGTVDRLRAGRFKLTPLIFSGQYNAERWSLTGEYAIRRTSVSGFGPYFPDSHAVGQSYYLQASYRFAPQWEVLLRYDAFYADMHDRDGKAFAAATRQPAFSRFARDWTTGIRFDVTPEFMLRAEYHRVNGTGFLAAQDNPDVHTLRRRWDMVMFLASFRF
ncbi:hypothetical protein [Accumulibacter sp.]|uniref:hypothetical protein n=1 Tax=Accumulibacter sp. TaxID=2053492 RepID=UPI00287AB172|nr:hypothetical protein [Accumulibacter sp.]MDS4054841.1 hypothetical protein [Accumulibacter sp.]HMW79969.1 hypothetical protein [Accumulibacter sp.]HNB67891.1 hypothetical protein [Accumulibacter sp.]HNC25987.1 hypothetical protein [Accumulibacter sp.]HNG15781.1 hypothetical protein [Accumulibacter sp.]